jgi:hypothetical protein
VTGSSKCVVCDGYLRTGWIECLFEIKLGVVKWSLVWRKLGWSWIVAGVTVPQRGVHRRGLEGGGGSSGCIYQLSDMYLDSWRSQGIDPAIIRYLVGSLTTYNTPLMHSSLWFRADSCSDQFMCRHEFVFATAGALEHYAFSDVMHITVPTSYCAYKLNTSSLANHVESLNDHDALDAVSLD